MNARDITSRHYADCYPVPQSEARGAHSFYRAPDGSLLVSRNWGAFLEPPTPVELELFAWLRKFAIITARAQARLDIGEGVMGKCLRESFAPCHLRLVRS